MIRTGNNPGLPPFNSPLIQGAGLNVTSAWWLFFINLWNRTGAGSGGTTLQSGDILITASNQPRPACLLCNGGAYDRVQYSDLFKAIGITWGAGNGTTTFNVPDTQDGILIGVSSTRPLGNRGTITSGGTLHAPAMYFYIKT